MHSTDADLKTKQEPIQNSLIIQSLLTFYARSLSVISKGRRVMGYTPSSLPTEQPNRQSSGLIRPGHPPGRRSAPVNTTWPHNHPRQWPKNGVMSVAGWEAELFARATRAPCARRFLFGPFRISVLLPVRSLPC